MIGGLAWALGDGRLLLWKWWFGSEWRFLLTKEEKFLLTGECECLERQMRLLCTYMKICRLGVAPT